MDKEVCLALLTKIRQEQAKQAQAPIVDAFQQGASEQLRHQALQNIRNLALTSLGVGAAGAGAFNLFRMLRRNTQSTPPAGGPGFLPLPYPVEPDESPEEVKDPQRRRLKAALFGENPTSLWSIPWYGPGMLLAGAGGLAGGWKGVDMILNKRRELERKKEIEEARRDFHDALLSQYDKPLDVKKAEESMGPLLDRLYDITMQKMAQSFLGINTDDLSGRLANLYGMYAVPSAIVTGAIVYDKARKRSRQAILEKALQRRERRRYAQQPTEIYAVPEPVAKIPRPTFREEMSALNQE